MGWTLPGKINWPRSVARKGFLTLTQTSVVILGTVAVSLLDYVNS